MAWPAVNKQYTQEQFRLRVERLTWPRWRPKKIVVHNTAAPSMAQWMATAKADKAKGLVPGITRMMNLENYFKNLQGWSGCPHLFIAPEGLIWEANPLDQPGVHSPSFNATAIGIEMIADFAREDDDAGPGLVVRNHTIFAAALLCQTLGLDPRSDVLMHRQDPKTSHKGCPGEDFARDWPQIINQITELLEGGEHDPDDIAKVIAGGVLAPKRERRGIVKVDGLNVRTGPGVANKIVAELWKGAEVTILDEAGEWLKIRTPAGYEPYWVAGRYVQEVLI